jgi:methylmalonyl-CoA/ethylmalonyl-CoA epimerase
MQTNDLAYVALVVNDVEAAAAMWETDFGLPRADHRTETGSRIPLLGIGDSALALVGPGDPFVDGETRAGVHHIALGVGEAEPEAVAADTGIDLESGTPAAGLEGSRRVLLSTAATGGIRTYLTSPVAKPGPGAGFATRLDHLGIIGTDNDKAVDLYCRRLGYRFDGEQTDTEMQVSIEHFVYKSADRPTRTVVHSRPAEFVAAVHDVFITVGDCELEIIQTLDTSATFRALGEVPGNTRQDHGALARFLETRGPGLHHMALKVDDVDAALERLAAKDFRLIDRRGRPGARCSRIGFIHPKSTQGVLVHFVERDTEL